MREMRMCVEKWWKGTNFSMKFTFLQIRLTNNKAGYVCLKSETNKDEEDINRAIVLSLVVRDLLLLLPQ